MTSRRLRTALPDLARRAEQWDETTRRRVVQHLTRTAAERAGVTGTTVEEALDVLDDRAAASDDLKERMSRIAEEYDDIAWDLEDSSDGEAPGPEYVQVFRRARAAAALRAALEKTREGDGDVLYETHHAYNDPREYHKALQAAESVTVSSPADRTTRRSPDGRSS